MAPKKTIEDTYQKKSQLEHVLHRPGMYIGDIENVTTERWVVDNGKFVRKTISYSPGLYKIFDEIFTNATDHSQRDTTMKMVKLVFLTMVKVFPSKSIRNLGSMFLRLFLVNFIHLRIMMILRNVLLVV